MQIVLREANTVLERLHWSSMNVNYGGLSGSNAVSYNTWKSQGCYAEISKRLGYRFELQTAEYAEKVKRGALLTLNLKWKNAGFANLYNPQHIEVVLKSTTGTFTRIRYQPATDERLWFPPSGKEKETSIAVTLPAKLAAGEYQVFLNFPDPEPSLNPRPEYSIRLANKNLWDPTTGNNLLNRKIVIN